MAARFDGRPTFLTSSAHLGSPSVHSGGSSAAPSPRTPPAGAYGRPHHPCSGAGARPTILSHVASGGCGAAAAAPDGPSALPSARRPTAHVSPFQPAAQAESRISHGLHNAAARPAAGAAAPQQPQAHSQAQHGFLSEGVSSGQLGAGGAAALWDPAGASPRAGRSPAPVDDLSTNARRAANATLPTSRIPADGFRHFQPQQQQNQPSQQYQQQQYQQQQNQQQQNQPSQQYQQQQNQPSQQYQQQQNQPSQLYQQQNQHQHQQLNQQYPYQHQHQQQQQQQQPHGSVPRGNSFDAPHAAGSDTPRTLLSTLYGDPPQHGPYAGFNPDAAPTHRSGTPNSSFATAAAPRPDDHRVFGRPTHPPPQRSHPTPLSYLHTPQGREASTGGAPPARCPEQQKPPLPPSLHISSSSASSASSSTQPSAVKLSAYRGQPSPRTGLLAPSDEACAAGDAHAAETEKALAVKIKDCASLSRKVAALEQHIDVLQRSDDNRLLEGRLAGAQELLQDKAAELEAEKQGSAALREKLDELAVAARAKERQIEDLERTVGQKIALLDGNGDELAQARAALAHVEAARAEQACKAQSLELQLQASDERAEHQQAASKAALREKDKQVTASRAEFQRLEESLRKEGLKTHAAEQRVQSFEAELAAAQALVAEHAAELEKLRSENSQQRVLAQGAQSELHRELQKYKKLEAEAGEAERAARELEGKLRDAGAELARKSALESKLSVLEGALARNESDFTAEAQRHKQTKQRVTELEEKLAARSHVEQAVQDLQVSLGAKEDTISHLKAGEAAARQRAEKLQHDVDHAQRQAKQLLLEKNDAADQRDALAARVSALEAQAVKNSGLEGKCTGLQEVLDQRTAGLHEANDRVMDLERALAGRQSDAAAMQQLKEELAHADAAKAEFSSEVRRLTRIVDDLQGVCENERGRAADVANALAEREEELRQGQAYIAECQREVAHKDSLLAHCEAEQARLDGAALDFRRSLDENAAVRAELARVQSERDTEIIASQRLTQQIDGLRSAAAAADRTVGELEMKLEAAVAEKQKAQRLSTANAREADQLARDLSMGNSHIAELEARVATYEQANAEATTTATVLTSEASQWRERSRETAARVCELEEACKSRTGDLSETQTAHRVLLGQHDALKELHARLAEDHQHATARIHELKAELVSGQQQNVSVQRLAHQVKTLRGTVAEKNEAIHALEEANEALQQELNDSRDACKQARGDADHAAKEAARLSASCEAMKAAAKQAKLDAKRASELEAKLSHAESLLGYKDEALEKQAHELREAEAAAKRLGRRSEDDSKARDRAGALRHELDTKLEVISQLELRDARARQTEADLRAEVDEKDAKLAACETRAAQLQSAARGLEQQLAAVEAEAELLLSEAHEQRRVAEAGRSSLEASLRDAETRVEQERAAASRSAERAKQAGDENTKLLEALMAHEAEKGRADILVAELRRRDDERKATAAQAAAQIAEMKDYIRTLERDYDEAKLAAETRDARSKAAAEAAGGPGAAARVQTLEARCLTREAELRDALQAAADARQAAKDLEARLAVLARAAPPALPADADRRTWTAHHKVDLERELDTLAGACKEKDHSIQALTQKCVPADEALAKFEDFSVYNAQLRESNAKLRDELEQARGDLYSGRQSAASFSSHALG